MTTSRDLILVTGSFYTIAPAREYLRRRENARSGGPAPL
jgi:folylpolyglutamate synthase/dihydropteroate synthase